MKILVTGGTVFVSRYTAEYFVRKGHEVFVLNRGTRTQPEGVKLIRCDRNDLGDRLKQYEFDLVIDVAAYSKKDIEALLNSLGNVKDYVFISSSAVYPERLPQPFTEEMQCGENIYWGAYGTNKAEAEAYLHSRVPNAYILRPPYLYGPMNNVYREAFVFECAENDLPFYVPGDGSMPLQFFHVEDMCRFIEIIIDKHPEQKIFNVGNKETLDINGWVDMCYAVLNKTPRKIYVHGSVEQRSYFPFLNYSYKLNVTKMRELMGKTKDMPSGLRESYMWYRTNKESVRRKPLLDYINENFTK